MTEDSFILSDEKDGPVPEDERSLLGVERRMKIVELVNRQKTVSIAEIIEWLGASPATVRRDLVWLDQQQLIMRTRGGALALDHTPQNFLRRTAPSYEGRLNEFVEEKKALGRLAAESIADGETIMLDASTTHHYLLPFLAQKRDLTVITNSLYLSRELITIAESNPSLTVICSGGTVFMTTHTFVGTITEYAFSQYFVDKAFIGVRGLSVQQGITSPFFEEIAGKRQMMKVARQVFVLADHTKLEQTFAGFIAPLNAIQTIITDASADPAVLQALSERGPRVQIAPLS